MESVPHDSDRKPVSMTRASYQSGKQRGGEYVWKSKNPQHRLSDHLLL